MHPQLEAAFPEDQKDHSSGHQAGTEAYMAMRERDRIQLVSDLLESGLLHTAEEFYAAARIFQHEDDLADFEQAHKLALKAAELGEPSARWMAAASLDRLLVHQGKLQKYGPSM